MARQLKPLSSIMSPHRPAVSYARICLNAQFHVKKINVDNNARFRYLNSYWFRLIDASICYAAAEARYTIHHFHLIRTEKAISIFLYVPQTQLLNNASISGSGDINAFDMNTKEASISIKGSGDCKVNVSDTLTSEIAGSGDVYCRGNPRISSTIKGSGSLKGQNLTRRRHGGVRISLKRRKK